MTAKPFQGVLTQTYAEVSVFGLQLLDMRLRRQYVELEQARDLARSQMQNLTEMADQHRDALKKKWRSIATCADNRELCVSRECTCSYADYLCFRGLRDAQRRLEHKYRRLAKDCYELKATWLYVLRPVMSRLLDDREYCNLFLATLELCGDITREERVVCEMRDFRTITPHVDAIDLIIGREPSVAKKLPIIHEPTYPRR